MLAAEQTFFFCSGNDLLTYEVTLFQLLSCMVQWLFSIMANGCFMSMQPLSSNDQQVDYMMYILDAFW